MDMGLIQAMVTALAAMVMDGMMEDGSDLIGFMFILCYYCKSVKMFVASI